MSLLFFLKPNYEIEGAINYGALPPKSSLPDALKRRRKQVLRAIRKRQMLVRMRQREEDLDAIELLIAAGVL